MSTASCLRLPRSTHGALRTLGARIRPVSAALLVVSLAVSPSWAHAATDSAPPALKTELAQAAGTTSTTVQDGVVEAIKQTVIAAQVAGAVVFLDVKVGDRIPAGKVIARIDSRAAEQGAAASDAQVQAARASLELASRELDRQKQLFQKQYISQAALDRAESEFKATQAQVNAQLAQAGAARTQTGLHVVRAPFAGVVAEVPVSLGDMAMPGRPLITLYDPAALRVTAAVPQSVATRAGSGAPIRIEIPGIDESLVPVRTQWLPTVDPGTHTIQVRADLPAGLVGVSPGMFARVWLPVRSLPGTGGVMVPARAIVRRAELTALYVLDSAGKPVLRQVRLGRVSGESVEVLAGVAAGERVVTEPQAAAQRAR